MTLPPCYNPKLQGEGSAMNSYWKWWDQTAERPGCCFPRNPLEEANLRHEKHLVGEWWSGSWAFQVCVAQCGLGVPQVEWRHREISQARGWGLSKQWPMMRKQRNQIKGLSEYMEAPLSVGGYMEAPPSVGEYMEADTFWRCRTRYVFDTYIAI